MRPPPGLLPAASRSDPPPQGPRGGFTLLALAVLLLVAAGAAAAGVPRWKKRVREARAAEAAHDLRQFAEAFKRYAHDRGDWPAATPDPGQMPPGMADLLPPDRWGRTTPLGGGYAWARGTLQRGERHQAAILILPAGPNRVTSDRDLLAAIDRGIDDGNLDTGRFRLGFRHQPVFVLEP